MNKEGMSSTSGRGGDQSGQTELQSGEKCVDESLSGQGEASARIDKKFYRSRYIKERK